jgi:hypothetical protein
VDQQLKELIKELGAGIDKSLADSKQVAEVVSRIKEGGYDSFLVLEATIRVKKQGGKTSRPSESVPVNLRVGETEIRFEMQRRKRRCGRG